LAQEDWIPLPPLLPGRGRQADQFQWRHQQHAHGFIFLAPIPAQPVFTRRDSWAQIEKTQQEK